MKIKNFKEFENCSLTGYNIYYPNVLINTNNELILPLLERTMSLKMSSIYEKTNMEFIINNDYLEKEIIDFPLFFFIYNTDNYFHFLYDTLPYLISYLYLKKKIPELKLLIQYPNSEKKDFYQFIIEFLNILEITNKDLVIATENVLYKTIYISQSYTHDFDSNLPPRKEIYDFYQFIVDKVKKIHTINTPNKIYISRRTWLHNDFSNIGTNYTTRRKMVNEDDVVQKLKKEGYVEIFTEKLSTIEKIIYFSNAKYIKGAIGGGVANVLFSPKETNLEVYVSPFFLDINHRFKYCLDNVNTKYNLDTENFEKDKFKKYMRVKSINDKIIGEIEDIFDDYVIISYTDGSNTGWNSQIKYNKMKIKKEEIICIDNGLNSSWIINNF
jgi:hypothetical protein